MLQDEEYERKVVENEDTDMRNTSKFFKTISIGKEDAKEVGKFSKNEECWYWNTFSL